MTTSSGARLAFFAKRSPLSHGAHVFLGSERSLRSLGHSLGKFSCDSPGSCADITTRLRTRARKRRGVGILACASGLAAPRKQASRDSLFRVSRETCPEPDPAHLPMQKSRKIKSRMSSK